MRYSIKKNNYKTYATHLDNSKIEWTYCNILSKPDLRFSFEVLRQDFCDSVPTLMTAVLTARRGFCKQK